MCCICIYVISIYTRVNYKAIAPGWANFFILEGPILETCLNTQEKGQVCRFFSFSTYNIGRHWSKIITLSLLKFIFAFQKWDWTYLIQCNSIHLCASLLYFHYPCKNIKNYNDQNFFNYMCHKSIMHYFH